MLCLVHCELCYRNIFSTIRLLSMQYVYKRVEENYKMSELFCKCVTVWHKLSSEEKIYKWENNEKWFNIKKWILPSFILILWACKLFDLCWFQYVWCPDLVIFSVDRTSKFIALLPECGTENIYIWLKDDRGHTKEHALHLVSVILTFFKISVCLDTFSAGCR